ncbi:MAG: AIR synthase-related protein [Lachnospiraceae bacterium]|nr:AIR synthase-related protein [Lachnospiraceae bacterium]
MRIGKVPENVLKRSVLKQIQYHKPEIKLGAGIGRDCAFFASENPGLTVFTANPVTLPVKQAAAMAVTECVNDMAAAGAEPLAVELTVLLPADTEEIVLRELMEQAAETAKELQVEIAGGHTEVTTAVNTPVIVASGVGRCINEKTELAGEKLVPGLDLIVTKWIGMEGTVLLEEEKRDILAERFPESFLRNARALKQQLSVVPEAAVAVNAQVCAMHNLSRGGILGALWEMAERGHTGIEVDLKKIPIKQETVEICELLECNPYQVLSGGAMLIAAPNGNSLVAELEKQNIPAVIIGHTVQGNDRTVINDDEKSFLNLPQVDELLKIFS